MKRQLFIITANGILLCLLYLSGVFLWNKYNVFQWEEPALKLIYLIWCIISVAFINWNINHIYKWWKGEL